MAEEPLTNGGAPAASPTVNGHRNSASISSTKARRPSVDRDAQEMVIESLRAQIQDLFSQVGQLNGKLVKSYDRVSDLEDDLHVASHNLRSSSIKISQLEMERTQHLSALNTGLLVEKTHVTTELNRLMEKATEEAAQRGQAETARAAIEKDLDDLSASLFGQANTMVAEARYEKHLSDRKVEDAQRALKSAEEAVQLMQAQMQTMQTEKEAADERAREIESIMDKGKWVDRRDENSSTSLRLLGNHSPYHEFLAFLAHLRLLHPTSPSAPAMSTLLPLPFLTRLLTEDSEPTIRLDLAPSLNWLSRRSVLAAIHSGQLSIEPVSAASLFAESSTYPTTTIAGATGSTENLCCSLCGLPVFQNGDHTRNPNGTLALPNSTNSAWSAGAFFRKPSLVGLSTQPSSPTRPNGNFDRRGSNSSFLNSQIYIFRLASPASTGAISTLSLPKAGQTNSPNPSYASSSTAHNYSGHHTSTPSQSNQATTIYPLCMSGWCLQRLRTTCTLWSFIRTGVVEKIWEEELAPPPLPPRHPSHQGPSPLAMEKSASTGTISGDKPPVPPRRRGLWGIASAIGERAASWGEGDKEKGARTSLLNGISVSSTSYAPPELPPEPPVRRSSAAPPSQPPVSDRLSNLVAAPAPIEVPPPTEDVTPETAPSPPPKAATPPPLPKRSGSRAAPPPATEPEPTPAVDVAEPAAEPPQVPVSPIRGTHLRTSSQGKIAPPPRSHTPSSVPLPESRPGTPAASPGATAITTAAADAGGPSRTASPGVAPPPIPRRAAARTRVAAGSGSRPTTPANAPEVPAVVPEKKEEENKETEVAAPVAPPEPKEETQEEAKETVKDEAPAAAKEQEESQAVTILSDDIEKKSDVTSPSSSDVFVDAETDAIADDTSAEKDAPAIESPEKLTHSPTALTEVQLTPTPTPTVPLAVSQPDSDADAHANDDLEALEHEIQHLNGDIDIAESVRLENEKAEAEAALKEHERLEKEKEKRDKEERDKAAGYIGIGTWEERTWKELVRLREDMFWARVGGVRE